MRSLSRFALLILSLLLSGCFQEIDGSPTLIASSVIEDRDTISFYVPLAQETIQLFVEVDLLCLYSSAPMQGLFARDFFERTDFVSGCPNVNDATFTIDAPEIARQNLLQTVAAINREDSISIGTLSDVTVENDGDVVVHFYGRMFELALVGEILVIHDIVIVQQRRDSASLP